MGVPLWRSIVFFVTIAVVGVLLFPSQREMGKLFSESQFFGKARFYLEKQYHMDTDDIANAERYLMSLLFYGDYELFEKIGGRLSDKFSDNLSIQEIMARYYTDTMQLEKASYYWAKIINIMPEDVTTRNRLIAFYLYTKNYDGVINVYEQVISNGLAHLEDFYDVADIYALKRNVKKTIWAYKKLLEEYPNEEKAKLMLADIYEYAGDSDNALELYTEVADLHPEDMKLTLGLAEKVLKYGKHGEMFKIIEKVAKHVPGSDKLALLIYDYYTSSVHKEEAQIMLERYMNVDPNNIYITKALGELYFDKKEYNKAIKLIEEYNEKTGGDYKTHHILGDIYADMGDTVASRREYEEALYLVREQLSK